MYSYTFRMVRLEFVATGCSFRLVATASRCSNDSHWLNQLGHSQRFSYFLPNISLISLVVQTLAPIPGLRGSLVALSCGEGCRAGGQFAPLNVAQCASTFLKPPQHVPWSYSWLVLGFNWLVSIHMYSSIFRMVKLWSQLNLCLGLQFQTGCNGIKVFQRFSLIESIGAFWVFSTILMLFPNISLISLVFADFGSNSVEARLLRCVVAELGFSKIFVLGCAVQHMGFARTRGWSAALLSGLNMVLWAQEKRAGSRAAGLEGSLCRWMWLNVPVPVQFWELGFSKNIRCPSAPTELGRIHDIQVSVFIKWQIWINWKNDPSKWWLDHIGSICFCLGMRCAVL